MLSHTFGQKGSLWTAGAFFWLMMLFNKYASWVLPARFYLGTLGSCTNPTNSRWTTLHRSAPPRLLHNDHCATARSTEFSCPFLHPKPCLHVGWFLEDEDFWEGRWSIIACSLVALESDSWRAHLTAHLDRWRVGLRIIGILHALSASCIFPLCLHASASNLRLAFLTDECQLSRSAGLLLPCLMADFRLC